MIRRHALFVIVGGALVVLFVRLGFWQLHRLGERRAHNDLVRARMALAPVDVSELPADTGASRLRRAFARGRFDYAHEIVLAGRSRNGAPGADIVTPFIPSGSGQAVLVNRGWVYAPDAVTVEREKWREGQGGDTTVNGFVQPLMPPGERSINSASRKDAVYRLDTRELPQRFPYRIAPYYLVATGDTGVRAGAPVRLPPPELSEGSHKSYAIQWFSFAITGVIGMIAYLRRSTR